MGAVLCECAAGGTGGERQVVDIYRIPKSVKHIAVEEDGTEYVEMLDSFVPVPRRLAEFLERGHEAKDLDFKSPMRWDKHDKAACCEVVKDILAMANTDGGFIVVGVEETNEGFTPVGMTSEEAASWETTRLNQFVARYAEPPVNATLGKEQIDDSTYIFIGVPEFPDVPHICKKEYPDVLTAPTLYIRTDDNNVDTVGHVLSTGVAEPKPSAAAQFQEQVDQARARFEEKPCAGRLTWDPAWREMVAFPAIYQPGRIGTKSLRDAVV